MGSAKKPRCRVSDWGNQSAGDEKTIQIINRLKPKLAFQFVEDISFSRVREHDTSVGLLLEKRFHMLAEDKGGQQQ